MNKKTFNNNKILSQNKTIFNDKKKSLDFIDNKKTFFKDNNQKNFNKINNKFNNNKQKNNFYNKNPLDNNNKDNFRKKTFKFNNKNKKNNNKYFYNKNFNQKKKAIKKAYKVYNIVVSASMHNTIIGLFDATTGNLIKSISAGLLGFKKHKRSSFIARESCAIDFINFVKKYVDIKNTCVKIILKGLGPGRYSFLKRIKTLKPVSVIGIQDHTPIPFNGVRAKKQRRL